MQTVPSAQVLLLTETPFKAQRLDMTPFTLGPLSLADSAALIQEVAPQVRLQQLAVCELEWAARAAVLH